MSVKLGEKLLQGEQFQCEHQRLVPIVTGAEIPFPEGVGQRHLGNLLAVAEYSELGFPGKDLLAAGDAGQPASECNPIIVEDPGFIEIRLLHFHTVIVAGCTRYIECPDRRFTEGPET